MTTAPWTQTPAIVPIFEMNRNNRAAPELHEFTTAVLSHLDKLPAAHALRYEFTDPKFAERCRNHLRDYRRQMGKPVTTVVRPADPDKTAFHLFVTHANRTDAPTPKAKPEPPPAPKPAPPKAPPAPKPAPPKAAPEPEFPVPAGFAAEIGVTDKKVAGYIRDLETNAAKWRTITNAVREPIVAALVRHLMAASKHRQPQDISVEEFNRARPAWMPTAWAIMQAFNCTSWAGFLADLDL